jgi:excisionase family DNA binding protein
MMATRPLSLPVPATRATRDTCTLLLIPEAAELLGLSRDSIYDLVHAGSLRSVLVKGKMRIKLTDLHAYVQRLT